MRYFSLILWMAILLVAALLLIACSGASSAVPTQGNSPTAVTIASASAPVPVPSTQPTPPATGMSKSPRTAPPPPFKPTSIHMFDAKDGWATGLIAATRAQGIFRTLDGGVQWENVSPPGGTMGEFDGVYFRDIMTGWATIGSSSGIAAAAPHVAAFRTTDGGRTWSPSLPLPLISAGTLLLDFIDPKHGWLMGDQRTATGSTAIVLFRTDDGGAQWQRISSVSGDPGKTAPQGLPLGCRKNGLGFLDTSTGWISGSCPGGPLFLFRTDDGGAAWQPQTLPPPAGFPSSILSNCHCSASPPTIFGRTLILSVQLSESAPSAFLYTSHDAGQTWSLQKLPIGHLVGAPDFIDVNKGWITDGQQLYATRDGGQTWTKVSIFPTGNLQGNLNFVSADDGWFTDGEQLFATHDGGQTWTPA